MNKRVIRGATASAAIAGAALMGASLVPAPANAVSLPGASKTKTLPEGAVSIKLYNEKARISKAVTNNILTREVMVSGKIRVTTSGDVKGGSVNAGYIVGCQVDFGAGLSSKGGVEQGFDGGAAKPSLGGGGEMTLGPGQAKYAPIVRSVVDDKETNSFSFGGQTGGVVYSGERFDVNGCAGYAQARAKVTVRVSTDTYVGNVTLYGKPFSIG